MRNLIVYMSQHGTTEKVAQQLARSLGEKNCTLINLEENSLPELNEFDTILIGGSIHMGRIQTAIKKFCDDNLEMLLSKRIGLFLCFMNKEQGQREFENAFPAVLRTHSSANGLFGGELLFDKMNFLERFTVKKVTGTKESVSALNAQAIESFSQAMHE